MKSRWVQAEADGFVDQYGRAWGEDVALRTYSARLLGADPSLVLHGGGNTSVKGTLVTLLGDRVPVVFVKASGADMAGLTPAAQLPLDLEYLRRLRALDDLDDATMVSELRTHALRPAVAAASIEALVHAFLPGQYVDHTHADAVLALTNQADGARLVREALGDEVLVLDYITPGFKLAKASIAALENTPTARALVWARHGLVTWGATARESYEATIDLVSKAETYLAARARRLTIAVPTQPDVAQARVAAVAPVVRGLLAAPSGDADRPYRRVVVQPLTSREVLDFVDSAEGQALADTPALTSDHLIRTKAWPVWVESPCYDDPARLREQVASAVKAYVARYQGYLERHAALMPSGVAPFDPLPRVVLLPGLGALCAGPDLGAATIARDITEHTLHAKALTAGCGRYEGLNEADLFRMEYRTLQHAKLGEGDQHPLSGEVAVVTGAAGAIGSGICRDLLEHGCLVAATDLPGEKLDTLVADLASQFGARVTGVPLDVTDASSVASAFASVAGRWGGVDLVIVNAGIAHVSSLDQMELDAFRRLERVNVEGTLLVLAESGRHFRLQGTGGDIVLVSTKNVFAPGAKFGAYSATKAAAHQLARIASLEMANLGVRVNMVAPDAVFSDGARKSGLWAEVGPDRMRARGLDEAGLEAYYRTRNLLKSGVTAKHVANAVMYFATRQSPTTGATIPVDGGLPDATPR